MTLTVLASGLLNTVLLGFVSRRLLGVPVGWWRTLLVSVGVLTVGGAVLTPVARSMGLVTADNAVDPQVGNAAALAIFTLLTAWAVAIGLAALVVLEAIAPTGSLPSPLGWLRDLPARRRRSQRYAAITAIAVRHGLGGFLSARAPARIGADEVPRVARALRLALTDAGVTYVKLGQMLATRPDVVGPAFARELGSLQSDVPAEPWPVVEQTLRTELGRDPREVFAEIEQTPLAAASVGQVHRARLSDGSPVVIKVQRPEAAAQVEADLDILTRLAAWLDRVTAWGRRLGVRSLAAGFAGSLHEELDYRVELGNTRAVADALPAPAPGRPVVRAPRVYEEVSTSRVLVQEEMAGVPVSRAEAVLGAMPAEQRATMATTLLGAVLRQILESGVFHADLHPGNVFVQPDGSMALLDLGAVGRLDPTARGAIGRLLLAVDRGDPVSATDALLGVLDRPAGLDDRALERDLGALLTRFGGAGSAGGSAAGFAELLSVVVRHGLAVPPQVAAVFRTLGALEGTLRLIDPAFDLAQGAKAAGRDLAQERFTPGALRAGLEEQLVLLLPALQRLPRRLDTLAEQLQRGELSLNVRMLADPQDRAFITGLVQQLVMTGLALACAVCGVLMVVSDAGPQVGQVMRLYPLLGSTLFLFAFVLGARVLALVFRHRPVGRGPAGRGAAAREGSGAGD